jgi:hypothetical protein
MKINVAELLHLAADEHLTHNRENYWPIDKPIESREKYSCCAIGAALDEIIDELRCNGFKDSRFALYEKIVGLVHKGLEKMGCDVGSTSLFPDALDGGPTSVNFQSQQDRYFWLKWAALMAEEQGVEYEID